MEKVIFISVIIISIILIIIYNKKHKSNESGTGYIKPEERKETKETDEAY